MKTEYLSSNFELLYSANDTHFFWPEAQAPLFQSRDFSWFKEEQHRLALKNKEPLLAKLQDPNINFVVTGHQAMLLGGPLFVLFKALTCIAQAEYEEKVSGKPVIPLFWVAGDDSDIKEISQLELLLEKKTLHLMLEKQGTLSVGEYAPSASHYPKEYQVSEEELGQGGVVRSFIKNLEKQTKGKLLFLDGNSPYLRPRARPLLKKLFTQRKEIGEILYTRQVALREKEFHPPIVVKRKTARLFEKTQQGRLRPETWREEAEYTHDVFSRVLLISYLFPVSSHVLGPNELDYFAQVAPLFNHLNLPFPQVKSRMHARVRISTLEENQIAALEEIETKEPKRLLREWGAKQLKEGEIHFHYKVKGIPQELMEKFRKKIEADLERLEKKWFKKISVKCAENEVDKVKSLWDIWSFMGGGRKQERVLSAYELEKNGYAIEAILKLNPLDPHKQEVIYV